MWCVLLGLAAAGIVPPPDPADVMRKLEGDVADYDAKVDGLTEQLPGSLMETGSKSTRIDPAMAALDARTEKREEDLERRYESEQASEVQRTGGLSQEMQMLNKGLSLAESDMRKDQQHYDAMAKAAGFPAPPHVVPESFVEEGAPDSFADIDAKLKALEEKTKAELAKLQSDTAAPSSFVEEDESHYDPNSFAAIDAKEKANVDKMRKLVAKWESEESGEPSSFVEEGHPAKMRKRKGRKGKKLNLDAILHQLEHEKALKALEKADPRDFAHVDTKLQLLEQKAKAQMMKLHAGLRKALPSSFVEEDPAADKAMDAATKKRFDQAMDSSDVPAPTTWLEAAGYPSDAASKQAYSDLDASMNMYKQLKKAYKARVKASFNLLDKFNANEATQVAHQKEVAQQAQLKMATLTARATKLQENQVEDPALPGFTEAMPGHLPMPTSFLETEPEDLKAIGAKLNALRDKMVADAERVEKEAQKVEASEPSEPSSFLETGAHPYDLASLGAELNALREKMQAEGAKAGKEAKQLAAEKDEDAAPSSFLEWGGDQSDEENAAAKLQDQMQGQLQGGKAEEERWLGQIKDTESILKADAAKFAKEANIQTYLERKPSSLLEEEPTPAPKHERVHLKPLDPTILAKFAALEKKVQEDHEKVVARNKENAESIAAYSKEAQVPPPASLLETGALEDPEKLIRKSREEADRIARELKEESNSFGREARHYPSSLLEAGTAAPSFDATIDTDVNALQATAARMQHQAVSLAQQASKPGSLLETPQLPGEFLHGRFNKPLDKEHQQLYDRFQQNEPKEDREELRSEERLAEQDEQDEERVGHLSAREKDAALADGRAVTQFVEKEFNPIGHRIQQDIDDDDAEVEVIEGQLRAQKERDPKNFRHYQQMAETLDPEGKAEELARKEVHDDVQAVQSPDGTDDVAELVHKARWPAKQPGSLLETRGEPMNPLAKAGADMKALLAKISHTNSEFEAQLKSDRFKDGPSGESFLEAGKPQKTFHENLNDLQSQLKRMEQEGKQFKADATKSTFLQRTPSSFLEGSSSFLDDVPTENADAEFTAMGNGLPDSLQTTAESLDPAETGDSAWDSADEEEYPKEWLHPETPKPTDIPGIPLYDKVELGTTFGGKALENDDPYKFPDYKPLTPANPFASLPLPDSFSPGADNGDLEAPEPVRMADPMSDDDAAWTRTEDALKLKPSTSDSVDEAPSTGSDGSSLGFPESGSAVTPLSALETQPVIGSSWLERSSRAKVGDSEENLRKAP